VNHLFERRHVVLKVVSLARKLALRPCHRRVGAINECAHGLLHVLHFRLAGYRTWHSEQHRVSARYAFLVRDTNLELNARVLVEVVEPLKDNL